MSNGKLSQKFNDATLKIFKLIEVLSHGEVPFSDVITLFPDSEGNVSQISNVILNKYLNTLKIYGIKVKKIKNKYRLIKRPFSISLDDQEIYTVSLIKSALSFLSDGKIKDALQEFVDELENYYDFDTQRLSTIVATTRNYDLSFYFMKFKEQIAKCEKCCHDGNNIEIYYIDSDNKPANMIAVPQEVKYFDKTVCLNVYNAYTQQNFDIPIDTIKNMRRLLTSAEEPKKIYTTVVFKLKGDLVKRYKLREWEKVYSKEENGDILISNKGEDIQSLAIRLFKYNENCVVISPKYLSDRISKMVNKTLRNYDL